MRRFAKGSLQVFAWTVIGLVTSSIRLPRAQSQHGEQNDKWSIMVPSLEKFVFQDDQSNPIH